MPESIPISGNVYQTQGNLPLAITDYNKALEISPNNNTSLYNRGLVYYGVRKWKSPKRLHNGYKPKKKNKEAYEDFIKNVPEKKTSDTKNVRNEIVQLFAEKLNSDKNGQLQHPHLLSAAEPTPAPAVVTRHTGCPPLIILLQLILNRMRQTLPPKTMYEIW